MVSIGLKLVMLQAWGNTSQKPLKKLNQKAFLKQEKFILAI